MIFELSRRACLALAAIALLHAPAAASAQAGAATSAAAAPRGFIWEATRGRDRVLLLGAIHVGRPEFAAIYSPESTVLRRAEVIAFEANIFDAQATAAATQRWAMYPASGPGMDKHVDAALLARIEKLVARTGGVIEVCCRMKPWMLANTLVVLEALMAGLNPAYGSEAQLFQHAMASGKPIVEIEGVDAQLRLFDEAPPGEQTDFLRHAVETIESGASRTEIERLVGAWERGDATEMERLVQELGRSDRPARRFFAERIVRGRHPKMVSAIERFAASGRLHLVAIGALHFFGPDGLLQALRDRGFAFKRLS